MASRQPQDALSVVQLSATQSDPAVGDAESAEAGPSAIPPKAKEILSLIGHTREVTSVVFSPRGDRVLTSGRDGRAILWLAREELDRRQAWTP